MTLEVPPASPLLSAAGSSGHDPTHAILELIDLPTRTLLFLRPPGFGKSRFLSRLRAFFSPGQVPERAVAGVREMAPDVVGPLAGTAPVTLARAATWQGRHPVIQLDLPETAGGIDAIREGLRTALTRAVAEHAALLDSGQLDGESTRRLERLLSGPPSPDEAASTLRTLSQLLLEAWGAPAVLLVDDYDRPLRTALLSGCLEETGRLLTPLFQEGLERNPHLLKAVVTGTLRFPLELAGLSNARVFDLIEPRFAPVFGVLEAEAERLGARDLPALRAWYGGYVMGGLSWLAPGPVQAALRGGDAPPCALLPPSPPSSIAPRPFSLPPLDDSLERLLDDLLTTRGFDLLWDLESLLAGGTVEHRLDESLVRGSTPNPAAVWAVLLTTGIVTAIGAWRSPVGLFGALRLPNRQAVERLEAVFRRWLERALGGRDRVEALLTALLAGDVPGLERTLRRLAARLPKYQPHDRTGLERLYQAFILGLRVELEPGYTVRTERSSGYWCYDVLVRPSTPGGTGIVLALKVPDVRNGETATKAVAAALERLERRGYAGELAREGATGVHTLAVVIDDRGIPTVRVAGRAQASGGPPETEV